MVTHEGGTIPAENLTNYNADRVKTLGESVLGLTVGCAQCHDHKFDPITQKDYYRLFAFFNALGDRGLDGDGGVDPNPFIQARTVLRTGEEPQLRRQIAALKADLARPDEALLRAWERREREALRTRGKGLKLHPLKVLKVSTPNRGSGFEKEGENRVRLRQAKFLAAFDISTQLPRLSEPVTGLRVVVHPLPELPGGGWGNGRLEPRRAEPAGPAEADRHGDGPKAAGKPGVDEPGEGPPAKGPPAKGTFILTALSVTADATPGDQVNL